MNSALSGMARESSCFSVRYWEKRRRRREEEERSGEERSGEERREEEEEKEEIVGEKREKTIRMGGKMRGEKGEWTLHSHTVCVLVTSVGETYQQSESRSGDVASSAVASASSHTCTKPSFLGDSRLVKVTSESYQNQYDSMSESYWSESVSESISDQYQN